jgi:anti-anti-sigma factor
LVIHRSRWVRSSCSPAAARSTPPPREQRRSAVSDGLHDPDGGPVVLDLTEVTFLSSTGLGALVDAQHAADRIGAPLRVVVDHARPVLHPIQLTGLDEVLTPYHVVDNSVRGDSRLPPTVPRLNSPCSRFITGWWRRLLIIEASRVSPGPSALAPARGQGMAWPVVAPSCCSQ